jgi:MFS family permease
MGGFTVKGVGEELAAVLPKDPTPWYRQGHLLRLNFTILCLVLFGSAMGYDGSMMNGLQALPQWQAFMHSPTGAWLGFINAVQSLGALLFVPVIAWSNNRFGRKKTLAWGYFWLVIGVAIQGGATNPAMFTLGRLCIGGVSAAFGATSPLLITEIAYPTHRSITTSLYNTGWYIGMFQEPTPQR